jgi:hypothetical protein
MIIHPSHFTAAMIFSFFSAVVFGITQKNTQREMVRYFMYCFAMFLLGTFVAGWAMALLRHWATR